MDANGSMVISDRVRELRRRRGMTQENLAEQAGLSLAVIKKIERGGSARMETYHQIARALGVNTIMFVAPDSPEPTEQVLDDVVLAEMRSVINPAHGLTGSPIYGAADGDEADLGRLRRALSAMATAYHADRYDDLAGILPSLVRSAHHHVEFFDSESDRREALRLRADISGLAGRYLIQIRAHDLALIALHASLYDAVEIGDTPLAAAAISNQAWAMLRQGRFGEVEQLCTKTADEIEPRVSAVTPDQLTAWGRMLLKASTAAARNNRPEEAREYLAVAAAAAAPLRREHRTVDDSTFGPLTVALKGPENALVGGRPEQALQLSTVLPGGSDELNPEEWDRHRLDLAGAHLKTGRIDKATDILTSIQQEHPAWLRYQQLARDTVRDILVARPRMLSEQQRQLADFMRIEV
ncbi:MAG: helix-turn-helix domain-containing protein [Actinomadura sp.]